MKAAALALLLAAGATPAEPVRYTLDPTHSLAVVEVPGALSTLRVRFARVRGGFVLDRVAATGSARIEIDLAAASSGTPRIDGLLAAPAVLDTAAAPTAVLAIDRVVFAGERVQRASGTLGLRGRQVPVDLQALAWTCYTSPLFLRQVCGGTFEARFAPAAFGIAGPATLRVQAELEGVKQ